jgi:uncharacterized protein YkwD
MATKEASSMNKTLSVATLLIITGCSRTQTSKVSLDTQPVAEQSRTEAARPPSTKVSRRVDPATVPEAPKELIFAKEEQELLDLTNEARKKEKRAALKLNPVLVKAARDYARLMSQQPDVVRKLRTQEAVNQLGGKNIGERLDALKYDWRECGQNIDLVQVLQPQQLHATWMKEPSYTQNILDDKFSETGIGIVKHPDRDEWYVAQVFASR